MFGCGHIQVCIRKWSMLARVSEYESMCAYVHMRVVESLLINTFSEKPDCSHEASPSWASDPNVKGTMSVFKPTERARTIPCRTIASKLWNECYACIVWPKYQLCESVMLTHTHTGRRTLIGRHTDHYTNGYHQMWSSYTGTCVCLLPFTYIHIYTDLYTYMLILYIVVGTFTLLYVVARN